jgi:hypothetical protein
MTRTQKSHVQSSNRLTARTASRSSIRRPSAESVPGRDRRATSTQPFALRRSRRIAWASIAVVVLTLVAVTVAYSISATTSSTTTAVHGSGAEPAPPSVLAAVTSVPLATLAKVGRPYGLNGPQKVDSPSPVLTGPGEKPEVLYVGAEYCPFCAAERWALTVALSHFGVFGNLKVTHSSTVDAFPDTQTLSYYGSTFTSEHLDFVSVELESNQPVGDHYQPLQHLSTAESSLVSTYDREPYTGEPGAIPFIDIANRFVSVGAGYDPSLLGGLSSDQIAGALSDPRSPVAQAIDGTANLLIDAISKATGAQPIRLSRYVPAPLAVRRPVLGLRQGPRWRRSRSASRRIRAWRVHIPGAPPGMSPF